MEELVHSIMMNAQTLLIMVWMKNNSNFVDRVDFLS